MMVLARIACAICCILLLCSAAVLVVYDYIGLAAIVGMLATALGLIAISGNRLS